MWYHIWNHPGCTSSTHIDQFLGICASREPSCESHASVCHKLSTWNWNFVRTDSNWLQTLSALTPMVNISKIFFVYFWEAKDCACVQKNFQLLNDFNFAAIWNLNKITFIVFLVLNNLPHSLQMILKASFPISDISC